MIAYIGFIFFFLLGLVFGYAVERPKDWLAVIPPLLYGAGEGAWYGFDTVLLVEVGVSVALVVIAVVVGRALLERGERKQEREEAAAKG